MRFAGLLLLLRVAKGRKPACGYTAALLLLADAFQGLGREAPPALLLPVLLQVDRPPVLHPRGRPLVQVRSGEHRQAADAAGSGLLPMKELNQVLMTSTLKLAPGEVSALLSSAEFDASGMAAYETLCSYAFYILQYIAQQGAISM